MITSGSQWFQWFSMVSSGSVVTSGYQLFSVVTSGSQWLPVYGGY